MNNDRLKIYIGVSNNFLHVLRVSSYLFNKFWSPNQEVVVIGYDEPRFNLPSNFSFVSLGKQRGVQWFVSDLYRMLSDIMTEKYFIHFFEDEIIVRPVNLKILKKIEGYLSDIVGRIDLTLSPSGHSFGNILEEDNDVTIFEEPQNADYRYLPGRLSIWNREYLLKYTHQYLNDDPYHDRKGTPWRLESWGSEQSKNDGYKILASKPSTIYNADACTYNRDSKLLDLKCVTGHCQPGIAVEDEIIDEMISLNIVKPNGQFFNVCGV